MQLGPCSSPSCASGVVSLEIYAPSGSLSVVNDKNHINLFYLNKLLKIQSEIKMEINKFITNIKNANNEKVKKEQFIFYLTKHFDTDESLEIINQFTLGAEKKIINIQRKDKISDLGFTDTQYGSVIIEFEYSLKKTDKHALEQLKDYFCKNWNTGIKAKFTLIMTDCIEWNVYSPNFKSLINIENSKHENIILEEIDSFTVKNTNEKDFIVFLDRYLFKKEILAATLDTIRDVFGKGSETYNYCIKQLYNIYNIIKNNSDIEVSFEQWTKFLSIAYGKNFNSSEEIYLIHSYLSIFAKILSFKVISENFIIKSNQINEIISGQIFLSKNISNFVEDDFYMWTSNYSNKIELKNVIQEIICQLDRFSFKDINEDILKGVYQELIDDDTRHALGEYYTPDWLCTHIINQIKPEKNIKIQDPSCGSGSFLKAAANYLIKNNPNITAKELSEILYGIDIHPLSVQISKATLIITIASKLKLEQSPINLNIFLANILLLPKEDMNLIDKNYILTINNLKISLPSKIFTNYSFLSKFIDNIKILSLRDKESEKGKTQSEINKILFNEMNINDNDILKNGLELYNIFRKIKKAGCDNIWAFIIKNCYASIFLKEKFDYIIGNPPWITKSDISSSDYQNEISIIAKKV